MESLIYPKIASFEDFFPECQPFIKEYKCPLCKGIYYNPVIDTCSHIFCENCFNLSYEQNPSCPITFSPLESKPLIIKLLLVILEKQSLYCRNKKNGCEWQGLYKDFLSHLHNDCLKENIKCSNPDCQVLTTKESMVEHKKNCEYRTVECEDCHITLLVKDEMTHKDICLKQKIKCPQNCEVAILREALESHQLKDCPLTLVNCPYMRYGCNDKFYRKDLEIKMKEKSTEHFILFTKSFEALEDKCTMMGSQLAELIHNNNTISTTTASKNNNPSTPKRNHSLSLSQKNNNLPQENTMNHKRKRSPEVVHEVTPKKIVKRDHDTTYRCSYKPTIEPSLFDTINLAPNQFKISGSKAKYLAEDGADHKFLLGSKAIEVNDKECITSWSYVLLSNSLWIALGVCDKEVVLSNNFKFLASKKGFNHGCFLISSNAFGWNANLPEQNNKSMNTPHMQRNTKVSFQYNPKTQELSYELHNCSGLLSHVYPKKGNTLCLCMLFLHPQDEIEVKDYNSFYHINK